ncbi:homeobox protein prospero isoform X2 [Culicoides brevitarsis]|uniref:homeobox protein prospero isoform X2 n=1 Tax=Culicoides brevitarsis TaxID=469753 RepID=UPI00307C905B
MMSSEEESDINNSSYDLLYDSVGDNKPAVQLQQLIKKQQFGICNNINSSLLEKQRSRQRVDAGEPRNSYSSIPNFSSRSAAFMNGGLYGAIFSQHQNNSGASTAVQQQQAANFGSLFGPTGYGPAKMLNDLLQGRTQMVKQENLMISPNNLNNNIGSGSEQSLLSANNNTNNIIDGQATLKDSSENNSCNNNSVVTANSLVNNSTMDATAGLLLEEAAAQATNDLAHHMLRNILQGKKELQLAIDQELRKVSAQSGSGACSERNSPDNNNTILNKNNNLTNNNNYDKSTDNALTNTNSPNNLNSTSAENTNQSDVNSKNSENNSCNKNVSNNLNSSSDADDKNTKNSSEDANSNKENNNRDTNIPVPKQEQIDLNEDDMGINSVDSDNSLDSPISNHATDGKDDIMDVDSDKGENSPSPILSGNKPEMDLKRARVENIVSSMRASPSLGASNQAQVNGCKKRKLYHPQQHDNTMMERYAAAAVGLNLGLNFHNFMMNNNSSGPNSGDDDDDEDVEPQDIHRKRVEKSMLKSQLKSMQDQLAEMQQKYMQLCTRMDQTSDTPDIDENSSDIVEDDMNNEVLNKRTSPLTKLPMDSPLKDMNQKPTPPTSNNLSQLMSKMMSAKMQGHLPPHLPPQFNGQLPFLQHLQQQQAMHDAAASLQQGGHENPSSLHAAAMYQKLIMEQHARRAKEAVEQQQQEILNQQREQQQQQVQMNSISVNSQTNMSSNVQSSGHSQQPNQQSPNQNQIGAQGNNLQQQLSKGPTELAERYNLIRNNNIPRISGNDLEELAETLKQEISTSLTNLVDTIVNRFKQQYKFLGKANERAVAASEQFSKDLMLASQLLDRKSPRTKVQDRSNSAGNAANNNQNSGNNGSNVSNNQAIMNNSPLSGNNTNNNPNNTNMNNQNGPRMNGTVFPVPPHGMGMSSVHVNGPNSHDTPNINVINNMAPHIRPPPAAAMFQPPKPPQGMSPVTAAALYNSMANLGNPNNPNPFCLPEPRETTREEQNEALSLVVTPKKKRHKVTDTRITPRTVSRILAQDGIGASTNHIASDSNSQNSGNKQFNASQPTPTSQAPSQVSAESPSPRQSYHPPTTSMLPSLPTSVAIPNPSLHESKVFSPYSPFFNPHGPQPSQLHHMHHMSASPPGGLGNMMDPRDSPPLPHPQTMLHPALLAAAHHGSSPDYSHIRAAMDANDRNSDCNSGDISYDGMQPTISFSKNQLLNNYLLKQTQQHMLKEQSNNNNLQNEHESITSLHSSTLTPMHLRKAKLMFFWVRYPSSAVLKMYFPDIKFNKNNTAQLVKWFSNFREFYYIQMEKYARQAVSEGVKNVDDIHITNDSEIYRVLNLHYNRNNHIEVPPNFRFVVEQTLREFFRAIQSGKDTEQSWKKSIYKIISRLDDPVPDYFKTPNFLEQLE